MFDFLTKKTCTNPLGKFRFFWTFVTPHFFGLTSIFFYPEDQKTVFSDLIYPKDTLKTIFFFLYKNHRLTTLKKMIFSTFLTLHFFTLKIILFCLQYQKKIFSGLICPKNTLDKIFDFFYKNLELTPLEKFPFFGLF